MDPRQDNIAPVCFNPKYHNIFSKGSVLDHVQSLNLLGDGKAFVDLPALKSEKEINESWEQLVSQNSVLSEDDVKGFLADNFGSVGWELERVENPVGWVERPPYLDDISCETLRLVGCNIQKIWKSLGARVSEEVIAQGSQTSMLYVPHSLVIPGGRFRENYYWDNYWIVKGLLASGLIDAARDILKNNFYMLAEYGLIPNGTRTYYLNRSQPPMLTSMVYDYITATGDLEFAREHLYLMWKEMQWWIDNRCIVVEKDGVSHQMFRYDAAGVGPRPESYREDVETVKAADCASKEEEEVLYRHLKAAAESGWDFSSRWIVDKDGGNDADLTCIRTTDIVPVDLNAIMYRNFVLIDKLMTLLEITSEKYCFGEMARNLNAAIDAILYDPKDRIWYDYDVVNEKRRQFYYASNLTPLWAECYESSERDAVALDCVNYLKRVGAVLPGGLVTSNCDSGQQWDYPNVWAPCQHFVVDGLVRTGNKVAHDVALLIATNFVDNAKGALEHSNGVFELYEKYDGRRSGLAGNGGEYAVQSGFGWTNGVVIEFIRGFGDALSAHNARI